MRLHLGLVPVAEQEEKQGSTCKPLVDRTWTSEPSVGDRAGELLHGITFSIANAAVTLSVPRWHC